MAGEVYSTRCVRRALARPHGYGHGKVHDPRSPRGRVSRGSAGMSTIHDPSWKGPVDLSKRPRSTRGYPFTRGAGGCYKVAFISCVRAGSQHQHGFDGETYGGTGCVKKQAQPNNETPSFDVALLDRCVKLRRHPLATRDQFALFIAHHRKATFLTADAPHLPELKPAASTERWGDKLAPL